MPSQPEVSQNYHHQMGKCSYIDLSIYTWGGGIIWDVILNGEKIGRLGAGEYIVKHRRSGANEIMVEAEAWWTKWQSENIQFTADNNANNFFIVYSQQVGFAGSELVLREVPEKQWKSLLSK